MIFSAGVILYVLGYVVQKLWGSGFLFKGRAYMLNNADLGGVIILLLGQLLIVVSVVILGLEVMP